MAAIFLPTTRLPFSLVLKTLLLGGMILAGTTLTGYAAGSAAVSVSATILSKSQCKFNTNTAVINFGDLNPASPVDVTATATLDFVCRGSAPLATFSFSDDDGLYESGPDASRMRHATLPGEFLAYGLGLDPVSGTVAKNSPQTLTVTGTIQGIEYGTAMAGAYSDTVTITISP
ncbi:MAG: spore coat protein U domain-containing protein [Desulfuromonadales bacterium]